MKEGGREGGHVSTDRGRIRGRAYVPSHPPSPLPAPSFYSSITDPFASIAYPCRTIERQWTNQTFPPSLPLSLPPRRTDTLKGDV